MSKIRTVIIEDHELTRFYICKALQQKDEIEVVGEAGNARHGLRMLKKLQPDVAIVDIGLPDQNGIELTKRIKAIANHHQLSRTKVLILTSSDNQESVLGAFSAGADSYCMKDIQFDNLLKAIRVTAEGNPWIDPMIARIILEKTQQKPDSVKSVKSYDHQQPVEVGILSDRELEVIELIAKGCSNGEIAKKLYIATGTVKTHVGNIMRKLSANDRTEVAIIALRSGLVT
ncbi:response regulator transcription factor [Dolichospermum sp. LEGE 00240]|jgi:DNA-binding NarL/FixJ family response regulator|uniref:response regulator n=1 Tax=Dolichospermum sp. LEGE 00240 TaxID=1828603 RepID=UPI00188042D8|nr:response regulator transcription factor [Dolichospermum sp. LEGE 00240]MBE9250190.1 response regulator transcription factor [Dolichospermum sp. LEGE 00240]MDM3853328.1 response regulator transcription factor [Aphanizomenon gracile PMC627.10]MDM3856727.1 response regulator transcription factor [Aphanizomenon gracile PMC649.10]MDM3862556.1 response regulator transcription factor [Aphanizomenon gracile PMC644.10]